MVRNTRTISWVKAALKDFLEFPQDARDKASTALTYVAEGLKPDIAKPLAGLGGGVWELAIKSRGDAFRVVYALQIGDENAHGADVREDGHLSRAARGCRAAAPAAP